MTSYIIAHKYYNYIPTLVPILSYLDIPNVRLFTSLAQQIVI